MSRPDVAFRSIDRRVTIADQVFDRLRTELMRCRFEAGHVFSISDLTAQFGVSRTPVREALSRLVSEGALRDGTRGEVRVPPIDLAEYRTLCDARAVVEGGATALAAQAVGPSDLARLRDLARVHRQAFDAGQIQDMLDANAAFHFAVYRAGRNAMLIGMAETLWLRAGPYTRLLARLLEDRIQSGVSGLYSNHHDRLIDALDAGDADKARGEMIADIRSTTDLLLPFFEAEA
ncbi:GntR family transcriptional regulator [Marinibacterium sp. SX1]|uniref:GntR family transcriptional regulator n=1 Tax=Marinibacterium sp. SX1 TaxID=3388424 RepID=UPI003D162A40